jgi:hypothetical protein
MKWVEFCPHTWTSKSFIYKNIVSNELMKVIREKHKNQRISISISSLMTESKAIIYCDTKPKINDSKWNDIIIYCCKTYLSIKESGFCLHYFFDWKKERIKYIWPNLRMNHEIQFILSSHLFTWKMTRFRVMISMMRCAICLMYGVKIK